MKVIIPMAGMGTRLRPHTHTRAKPMVHVAGKPVLGHILDQLKEIKVTEVIFIIGYLGEQAKEYVENNYDFKTRFIVQKELKGQAHALKLAEEFIEGDVLIWFVDTISDPDIKKLKKFKYDGLIYVKEHDDPERFGIVFPDEKGFIKKIVEKPKNSPSNLANIGMYYIKNSQHMLKCIDYLIEHNMQTKGEFYLVDVFNIMIREGAKFKTEKVNFWEDCGKPETLLTSNKYLIRKVKNTMDGDIKDSMIIKPVVIEKGVKIRNSIVGPDVSIAKGANISSSIIKNSIVGENALVKDAQIKDSLIGSNAVLKGFYKRLNIGDDSEIVYGNEDNS